MVAPSYLAFNRNTSSDVNSNTGYTYPVNVLYISNNCYNSCQNIKQIDLNNIPFANNNMDYSFYNCLNLTNVSNINNNVSNMAYTFYNCVNITTVPVIPNSVTNMQSTFEGCNNLSGRIYISSYIVTDATNCFNNTNVSKNVYIPFVYNNGVKTPTYNSFNSAGCATLYGWVGGSKSFYFYTYTYPAEENTIIYDSTGNQYIPYSSYDNAYVVNTENGQKVCLSNSSTGEMYTLNMTRNESRDCGKQWGVILKDWSGEFVNLTVNVTPPDSLVDVKY